MSDDMILAKVPKGISISNEQACILALAYVERGFRPFSDDEIVAFVERGIVDVTDFSKVEVTVEIVDASEIDDSFRAAGNCCAAARRHMDKIIIDAALGEEVRNEQGN